MAIVYRHTRLDTNEVFYIGIGKNEKRAYSKFCRNNFWHKIVNKTQYSVEIIATTETWELACELEMFLIEHYGRRNKGEGTLVNMTDGGDGATGQIMSVESREKMSKAKKGIPSVLKGVPFTEEHKENLRKARIGRKLTEEHKSNISKSNKGRIVSEHTRKKLAEKNYKKVIDTLTGEIYNSLKECATINGITYPVLSRKLTGVIRNDTNFKYL